MGKKRHTSKEMHEYYKAKYYRELKEKDGEAQRGRAVPEEEDIVRLRGRESDDAQARTREITKRFKLTAAQITKEREETLERLKEPYLGQAFLVKRST
jgi:hypothetical protein